ncbi:DNA-directed RNA polymerase V subunit 1 isoform X2 [Manihot esculenta]|uniref:DNA-directed RNA polymerase V subunit 1 isoform X2 n=1 Tax=Manihot esculenta TaxID=3983 RepID=UPI001CC687C7|nr:DNA-directed RNA polymerase V subunit 1 isoform X2 [Manihot esculenta]
MEDNVQPTILEGEVVGIRFGLATHKEISTASVSDCPISHSSQLTNPFLGLPLEFGKCESCGTSEPGKCEGHFGYIELPIPIYHPSHVSELKRLLSLLCLKCLKMKTNKVKSNGVAERLFSCCEEASQISIKDIKTTDGAFFLKLKLPSRMRMRDGFWNFLERYGFRYGDDIIRTLLPCEVMEMLRRIPQETRKKLARKGYFPQDGYIMRYIPVPPNCLSVPDISDGISVMSSDLSISMLKKVLKQVEIIKSSRSGPANFESHEVEAVDLQSAVDQYLQVRGTARASRDVEARFGVHKESNDSSTKAWLEKMRTLFIRKGSGFSSRSVITGDAYKRVNEIGIPFEIAQRITFEERVNVHNIKHLQELVDNKLCLTYKDGSSTYSLREGSKGHTFLRPGQIVHRRIMDGDKVFINRPPTTHKHSLQALSVYVHDDHTVKINPLICGPLSADFDGDCIHLFYPQSLAAKAEVLELFSVEKQLLSSHSGNLNLQLTTDSLLSLKRMFKENFLNKAAAQQLALFVSSSLPQPALRKVHHFGPFWTAPQILQMALPSLFDCIGERYLISEGDFVKVDFSRDSVQAIINEVVISIFFEKGPDAVFKFFNSLQPLLMENMFSEGFSVDLKDFYIFRAAMESIHRDFKVISPLLSHLRSRYNELVELQLENHIRYAKLPVEEFILRSSSLGELIDCKSDSAMTKLVQQIGFLGLQISDRGKFYTKTLVEDVASHFERKYPSDLVDYPSAQYGLIQSCFFHGLDPYEEMVHSISTREVIVRSSRGLSEPGTLFKNLMAILRDVVICYDGTVRNVCSNSIIQFEYGVNSGVTAQSLFPAGEPVGVLAATAMSNPAYKAVLDSTPSSNSSWELMKEILLCRVNFKNDLTDRRIILYFNDCGCGRSYCQEKAAYLVRNSLERVILKDIAKCFMIEYKKQQTIADASLVGHIHLEKMKLQELNVGMEVILQKCKDTITSFRKKKKHAIFKKIEVSMSECCSFEQSYADEWSSMPCLTFFWLDPDVHLENISHIFADVVCPVLLETIIKGDHRISSASIIWVSPDTTTWIRNPSSAQKGELALDVVIEKSAVKQSGDGWRIVLDSCLPVLHLIDTTRSIPYAIKQVQELLGVSCAFDQAVQRLSTSVKMVAKGVLKEHLVLLANSMTCAGNLVGFNSGGYKSLSRSLDIQVPFTEATLFTPRKCFERAAEKCHVDTLSSVVASCSWGKCVAVGTGSRFDLLWDQGEACFNQEGKTDVYEFLNMVRSANGEESVTACLGAEVDELMEDEIDWNLSPEHNFGSEKPIFEDTAEFQEKPWSSWGTDTVETQNALSTKAQEQSDKSSGWDTAATWQTKAKENTDEASTWSGWRTRKTEESDLPAMKVQKNPELSSSWDNAAAWQKNVSGSTEKIGIETNSWSGWGTRKTGAHDDLAIKPQEETGRPSDKDDGVAWGKGAQGDAQLENYGATLLKSNPNSWSGWDRKATENQLISGRASSTAEDWSKDKSPPLESCVDNSSWGKPKSSDVPCGWGSPKDSVKARSSLGWGLPDSGAANSPDVSRSWDLPKDSIKVGTSQGWGLPDSAAPKSPEVSHCWDLPKDSLKAANSLKAASSQGWGLPDSEAAKSPEVTQDWGLSKESVKSESSQGWGLPNSGASPEVSQGWGSSKESVKAANSQGWGLPNSGASQEVSQGWGSANESVKAAGSQGWGLPDSEAGNGSDRQQQWGQQQSGEFKRKRAEGSRGWGSKSADWKSKNRPAKSPGNVHDDSSMSGMYTATRQRLDMFTSEEQDILSDIEPLMRSIRRVMHQSGYNDGDALSAADQSYVLDNVFNYHPDKAAKMGSGIDHVTVSKHSSFQESRCFYVVSTDGSKQDFSYRKCLENFIKGKYPDLAEEFIEKYFTRPRARANRQQQNSVSGRSGDDSQQQNLVKERSQDDNQVQNLITEGNADENRS